jgi:hypothetical protein
VREQLGLAVKEIEFDRGCMLVPTTKSPDRAIRARPDVLIAPIRISTTIWPFREEISLFQVD